MAMSAREQAEFLERLRRAFAAISRKKAALWLRGKQVGTADVGAIDDSGDMRVVKVQAYRLAPTDPDARKIRSMMKKGEISGTIMVQLRPVELAALVVDGQLILRAIR